MKVWAFQHIGHENLGTFEPVLKQRGADIRYICGKHEDISRLDAAEADLIILLGGPISVYDADNYPYLHHEIRLTEERVLNKKPLMGICLGAQIIAKTLGAKIYAGDQGKEIGWAPITINADGMQTALRHLDASQTNMMHWHGDTFDLPKGATLLASSAKYKKQAYMYGDHIIALQCHPEISNNKINLWVEAGQTQLDEVGVRAEDIYAGANEHGGHLSQQAALFLNEWLDSQGL